jgi:hypothetical protein
MNQILSSVIKELDSVKGGGSAVYAQANGPMASKSKVEIALIEAEQKIVESFT